MLHNELHAYDVPMQIDAEVHPLSPIATFSFKSVLMGTEWEDVVSYKDERNK
jgi:hypothetical protein